MDLPTVRLLASARRARSFTVAIVVVGQDGLPQLARTPSPEPAAPTRGAAPAGE